MDSSSPQPDAVVSVEQKAPYQHQEYPPPAYEQQAPIQQQPGFAIISNQPSGYANFHDYLKNAASFRSKQEINLLEILFGWQTENNYSLENRNGIQVFKVEEESSCGERQFCGNQRSFNLTIKSSLDNQALLRIERPLNWCFFRCGCCCKDKLSIYDVNGIKLGSVSQSSSFIIPKFDIKDRAGNVVLKIVGPFCTMSIFCQPVEFEIFDLAGNSIGKISKEWSGYIKERFTDSDYISMSFPQNLDPIIKAILLGALFIIEYEYFEDAATLPYIIPLLCCRPIPHGK